MARRKTVAEQELDKWVAAEAKHIKQRAKVDFDREAADVIQRRLDTVGNALRKAEKESLLLARALHRNRDKNIPASVESDSARIHSSIADAVAIQFNATDNVLRHIQTNAPASGHVLHNDALKAAYEYCGPSKSRAARGLAKRILEEAGIAETEWGCDKSISNWLNKIRSERA